LTKESPYPITLKNYDKQKGGGGKTPATLQKLKVLFITDWYPNPLRPVEGVFVREHAKAVARFAQVAVLHCGDADRKIRGLWEVIEETCPELTHSIPTFRIHRHTSFPIASILLHMGSVFNAYRRITATGFVPDIIHAHVFYAGLPAVLIGKRHNIPVVITEHSSSFPRKLINRRGIMMARFAFQHADLVLPVSQALQHAIASYGIRARFQVLPNVVDTRLFYPASSPGRASDFKRFLMVALMDASHNKGFPVLFEALSSLPPETDNWHLDLLGDGQARPEYEKMVRSLNLTQKITFHGLQPKPRVAEFMRQADFLVLPSLWENMGCVLIEAQACGVPSLATRTGGIPEIVSEDTGILVPPGDPSALRGALLEILRKNTCFDPQVIVQKARRFSSEVISERLHHIYDSCLHPGT
jgi:glycosyltransferase involved in cell wall biosynthesis